uniref:Pecanex-like protein n=1 Tax=Heterorhabditis bacteriophora TaxID=37862 RepID=A0A1I7WB02_HETBA
MMVMASNSTANFNKIRIIYRPTVILPFFHMHVPFLYKLHLIQIIFRDEKKKILCRIWVEIDRIVWFLILLIRNFLSSMILGKLAILCFAWHTLYFGKKYIYNTAYEMALIFSLNYIANTLRNFRLLSNISDIIYFLTFIISIGIILWIIFMVYPIIRMITTYIFVFLISSVTRAHYNFQCHVCNVCFYNKSHHRMCSQPQIHKQMTDKFYLFYIQLLIYHHTWHHIFQRLLLSSDLLRDPLLQVLGFHVLKLHMQDPQALSIKKRLSTNAGGRTPQHDGARSFTAPSTYSCGTPRTPREEDDALEEPVPAYMRGRSPLPSTSSELGRNLMSYDNLKPAIRKRAPDRDLFDQNSGAKTPPPVNYCTETKLTTERYWFDAPVEADNSNGETNTINCTKQSENQRNASGSKIALPSAITRSRPGGTKLLDHIPSQPVSLFSDIFNIAFFASYLFPVASHEYFGPKSYEKSRVSCSPGPRISRSPGPRVSRSPGPRVSRSPGPQVSRSPGPRVSHSPGPRVSHSPGPRVSRSPGPRVSRSPGPRVSRSPGPRVSRSPDSRSSSSPGPRIAYSPGPWIARSPIAHSRTSSLNEGPSVCANFLFFFEVHRKCVDAGHHLLQDFENSHELKNMYLIYLLLIFIEYFFSVLDTIFRNVIKFYSTVVLVHTISRGHYLLPHRMKQVLRMKQNLNISPIS